MRRLLGHLTVTRRVPRADLVTRFGSDAVTAAFDDALIAADFFGATDITERGMTRFNAAPLERRAALASEAPEPKPTPEASPATTEDVPDPKPSTNLEPETLEVETDQESAVKKPDVVELTLYETLVGVFQNAEKPLTMRELLEITRTNRPALTGMLSAMENDNEITVKRGGRGPTATKLYGFSSVFNSQLTPALNGAGETPEIAPWSELEVLKEHVLEVVDQLLEPDVQTRISELQTELEEMKRQQSENPEYILGFNDGFDCAELQQTDPLETALDEQLESDPTHAVTFPPRNGTIEFIPSSNVVPLDRELEAMNAALAALQPLEADQQDRAVDWLIQRLGVDVRREAYR
ncbi:MAG: hypothetical protein HC933_09685 [Pleurocapsa sp. SU_196_0]|nr:hypothetical protein [Pleurocapsa sp. SU_196_0]